MKSLKSIHRKAAKAKARRKDFSRRKNINANVPVVQSSKTERVETFRPAKDKLGRFLPPRNGRAQIEHVGYATRNVPKLDRKHIYKNHVKGDVHTPLEDQHNRMIGMIAYPPRRKYRSKKLQTA